MAGHGPFRMPRERDLLKGQDTGSNPAGSTTNIRLPFVKYAQVRNANAL